MLYQLVIYVEFGPKIVFRRLLSRHVYTWNQVKSVAMRKETARYLFGLVRISHSFIDFSVEEDRQLRHFSCRITPGKRGLLERILRGAGHPLG